MNIVIDKIKILIIDNNWGILFSTQKALELKNYEVVTTSTFEGVGSIIKISPHLILLDVSLMGLDGCEVCRELKANARTKDIPVILLTGHSNAAQLTVEALADDYLLKPFSLVDLWALTAKHTSQLLA